MFETLPRSQPVRAVLGLNDVVDILPEPIIRACPARPARSRSAKEHEPILRSDPQISGGGEPQNAHQGRSNPDRPYGMPLALLSKHKFAGFTDSEQGEWHTVWAVRI